MDTIQLLGSAMGLGLLAGIRLYATVFTLGLAIRMGWFNLWPGMSHLEVIAQTPVLVVSGLACAIEFLADKIPWIDSTWDSVHTFIRPIGAALLGATALGDFEPGTKIMIALLCGGIALTGHATKTAARVAVNHSPEPFSNVALSTLEDLFVPFGIWLTLAHPLVVIVLVTAFLIFFVWIFRKIVRLLRESWSALVGTAPATSRER